MTLIVPRFISRKRVGRCRVGAVNGRTGERCAGERMHFTLRREKGLVRIGHYIDPEMELPYRCGVSEAEVEEVLQRAGPKHRGIEIGRTSAGRYVRVINLQDPEPSNVIMVHGLRGKPLTASKTA